MYQATRLFASNMDTKMAQRYRSFILKDFYLVHIKNRFYNIILLPRIRDDIDEYKKLNFHLYMVKLFLIKKKNFISFLTGIEKSYI